MTVFIEPSSRIRGRVFRRRLGRGFAVFFHRLLQVGAYLFGTFGGFL